MFTVKVPPTQDHGSYTTKATSRADALRQYNSARAHDGSPPLSRMPAGTVYTTTAAFYIQRKGQGIRETVDQFETRKEARAMLAEYRLADPSADYYISSRACRGWND